MILFEAVLPFLGILVGLVVLHELGHFVVAKLAGVRVEEFGVGMPPRIWGRRFGETLYSINWLPLGGFVRPTGEDSARLAVAAVNPHGPGDRADLQPGDVILAVHGAPVHNVEQLARHLGAAAADPDPIALIIERETPGPGGPSLQPYDVWMSHTPTAAGAALPADGGATAQARFHALIGEIAGVQVEEDPRSLNAKRPLVRIAILAAGAGVNAVLPIILFAVAAMVPHAVAAGPAVIASVIAGAPAATAGLQPGDRIVSINGHAIRNTQDVSVEIQKNLGGEIRMVVERTTAVAGTSERTGATTETLAVTVDARLAPPLLEHTVQAGETVHAVAARLGVTTAQVLEGAGLGGGVPLEPGRTLTFPGGLTYLTQKGDTALRVAQDLGLRQQTVLEAAGIDLVHLTPGTQVTIRQGATGISVANERPGTVTERTALIPAIGRGWDQTLETLIIARNRIRSWIAGGEGLQFTGPIGIAQTTGEVVEEAGWVRLIELAALLSLNLAIINILPLPMLDGGRIFFVLIEMARRGKRISPEKEALVHLAGFALLITMVIVVSYFDIVRVVSGESALR